MVRTCKCKVSDDVSRKAAIDIIQNKNLSFTPIFRFHTMADLVYERLHEWSVALNTMRGEERKNCLSPRTVKLIVCCCKGRGRHIEAVLEEFELAVRCRRGVYCLEVFHIVDMDFPRVDTNNRPLMYD